MFPSDRVDMTRHSDLSHKFSSETTGDMAQWYVGFVFYRAYLSVAMVIHNAEEEKTSELELHLGASMELALDRRWITGYQVVRTRKTYPHTISTIRLFLPEGKDRSIWKRLLGNRAYNNLHVFAKQWADAGSQTLKRRFVPPAKDSTYYGKHCLNNPHFLKP